MDGDSFKPHVRTATRTTVMTRTTAVPRSDANPRSDATGQRHHSGDERGTKKAQWLDAYCASHQITMVGL